MSTGKAEVGPDLATRLADEPDVVVAYLFGSRARGTARPGSDADVAVLLDEDSDVHQRTLDLMAALGEGVDVVVLNEAPVALAYRVLRDGVLPVCRDEQVRVRHRAATISRYLDTVPLRRTLEAGLRQRNVTCRWPSRRRSRPTSAAGSPRT
ncbi:MAG: nucleotidyltransferase domain-containing protein [Egibacteraceae bacterium]